MSLRSTRLDFINSVMTAFKFIKMTNASLSNQFHRNQFQPTEKTDGQHQRRLDTFRSNNTWKDMRMTATLEIIANDREQWKEVLAASVAAYSWKMHIWPDYSYQLYMLFEFEKQC